MNRLQTRPFGARTLLATTGVVGLLATGCAGTYPLPVQPTSDIEAATRSANELGAQRIPQAQLYLKLANEQLDQAKQAASNDDPTSTDRLLRRAQVDAELALALTRSGNARAAANKAIEASNAARPQPVSTLSHEASR